jgi:flagellar basal body-associated protein FliL
MEVVVMSNENVQTSSPSFSVIIMVTLAVTLSAVSMLMSADVLMNKKASAEAVPVKVVEVYKNLVPVNAFLQDANGVVVLVELNYEHADYEILHVKQLVQKAAAQFPSDKTSLVEEEIRKSPRVKNAWVYFKRITIKAG